MTVPAAKARLVPLWLTAADDPDFAAQTARLRELLAEEADVLAPLPLGAPLPDADAAVFPQLVGEGYRRVAEFRALTVPLLVLTSEFGTMAMWDWELLAYLRGEGVETLAPYSLEAARTACRALAAKRELQEGRFVVYQDEPGVGGFQPSIFKRFYWWEDECADRMRDAFGLELVHRSYRELAARAKEIPDGAARAEWERRRDGLPVDGLAERPLLAALKLYLALRDDLDAEHAVLAAGINCLNESAFSDTTPCLALDLLHRERGLVWGCEGDVVSMLTAFLLQRALRAPTMMTNLYPFLMGQAALKHERIPAFPEVERPDDHVLVAHCGYFGLMPRSFASEWTLRPKVLAIVDENAHAIDARFPVGAVMLSKLEPSFARLVVADGELTGYADYPGSDCRTGGVIRVRDGHALMRRVPSHHSLLTVGHDPEGIDVLGRVFGLEVERI